MALEAVDAQYDALLLETTDALEKNIILII